MLTEDKVKELLNLKLNSILKQQIITYTLQITKCKNLIITFSKEFKHIDIIKYVQIEYITTLIHYSDKSIIYGALSSIEIEEKTLEHFNEEHKKWENDLEAQNKKIELYEETLNILKEEKEDKDRKNNEESERREKLGTYGRYWEDNKTCILTIIGIIGSTCVGIVGIVVGN